LRKKKPTPGQKRKKKPKTKGLNKKRSSKTTHFGHSAIKKRPIRVT